MTVHTTNYFDTFIQIADDCPTSVGEIPGAKGDKPTVANQQFDIISKNPYKFNSDDVLFQVFADRNDLIKEEYEAARTNFFSKGQPCLRASPLPKRYGWGVHYDKEGRVAIFAAESEEYEKFSNDPTLKVLKAMKSKR